MSDVAYSPPNITRGLVRRWWLLLLLAVLGGAGGFAFGLVQAPTYEAHSYVVVVAEDGKTTDVAINFAQAYGRVVTQSEILDQVATSVGHSSAASLRTKVRASTSPDTPLIEITGSAGTAARSADIANAVVDALVTYGGLNVNETGVRIASFSRAAVPPEPVSPRPVLDTAVGAAAGVLIGGLAVLAGIGRPPRPARPDRGAAAPEAGASGPEPGPEPDPAVAVPAGGDPEPSPTPAEAGDTAAYASADAQAEAVGVAPAPGGGNGAVAGSAANGSIAHGWTAPGPPAPQPPPSPPTTGPEVPPTTGPEVTS